LSNSRQIDIQKVGKIPAGRISVGACLLGSCTIIICYMYVSFYTFLPFPFTPPSLFTPTIHPSPFAPMLVCSMLVPLQNTTRSSYLFIFFLHQRVLVLCMLGSCVTTISFLTFLRPITQISHSQCTHHPPNSSLFSALILTPYTFRCTPAYTYSKINYMH
jgi:hypothetical protein